VCFSTCGLFWIRGKDEAMCAGWVDDGKMGGR
jgi:hypothetical protein